MCWSGPHSELGGPFQFFGVPYHGFLHLQPARVTFDVTSVVEMGPKEMRKRATPAMAAAERIIGLRALEDCSDTIKSWKMIFKGYDQLFGNPDDLQIKFSWVLP